MPEGGIPSGAFAAGNDGGSIFVCRVAAEGGLRIGKLTDEEWCYVADAGEEKTFTSDYEVLVE